MVYGPPAPAIAGSNVFPDIPGPLNVPPEGEPVKVMAAAFGQIEAGNPVKFTVGNRLTVAATAKS